MTALVIIVAVLAAGAVITFLGTWLITRRHRPGGRFIDVGGVPQHVVEMAPGPEASGTALPVVLLHGAGANLLDMDVALGERLALRHRVILIDRPGFGFSARGTRKSASPAFQAGVVNEIFDRLGVSRAIVVGHSWGGSLALTFALDYPQRVAGLVLVASPTHPTMSFMTWHNALFTSPLGWLFARTLALPLGALLIELGIRAAFLPQTMPPRYSKRTAAWLILRPATLMANWQDVGGLDPFLRGQVGRYGELAAPTIALNGDRDPVVKPERNAAKLAEAAPVVKVEILPGFGHMLHHAAADRVASAVEDVAVLAARPTTDGATA